MWVVRWVHKLVKEIKNTEDLHLNNPKIITCKQAIIITGKKDEKQIYIRYSSLFYINTWSSGSTDGTIAGTRHQKQVRDRIPSLSQKWSSIAHSLFPCVIIHFYSKVFVYGFGLLLNKFWAKFLRYSMQPSNDDFNTILKA